MCQKKKIDFAVLKIYVPKKKRGLPLKKTPGDLSPKKNQALCLASLPLPFGAPGFLPGTSPPFGAPGSLPGNALLPKKPPGPAASIVFPKGRTPLGVPLPGRRIPPFGGNT